MAISDSPKDVPVSTIRSEFLFTANRPEHSAAVMARISHLPDGHTLTFDSAVIYQGSECGGLSRIIVKYVAPTRTVLVESRPSTHGPVAETLWDTFSPSQC
jgi:hypothetical protein